MASDCISVSAPTSARLSFKAFCLIRVQPWRMVWMAYHNRVQCSRKDQTVVTVCLGAANNLTLYSSRNTESGRHGLQNNFNFLQSLPFIKEHSPIFKIFRSIDMHVDMHVYAS